MDILVFVVLCLCFISFLSVINFFYLIFKIRKLMIENDDLYVRLRLDQNRIDRYEHIIDNLNRKFKG